MGKQIDPNTGDETFIKWIKIKKGEEDILPLTRITTRYDNNNQIITEVTEDYDKNEVRITIPLYYLFGMTEKPTQMPELEKGDYQIQIYTLNTASTPISTIQIKANDMPFVLKFYHHDHLGTVRYITNENGEILHTTDTLAYGEELTAPYEDSNDKVLNTITYTGHEKDYETNLTYMLARYYSQGYGRSLSPDPGYDYDQLDPMSWNLYSYVRGNPVNHFDPTGKWDEKKRAEMRKKLKNLKMRDKHAYMLLMHQLKMAVKAIDSGKRSSNEEAMQFIQNLDKSGLEAAFEDENGNVRIGKYTESGPSYLMEAQQEYLVSESAKLHLQTMDKLSEGCDKLSYIPFAGQVFSFLSGWFGINGSVNSKSNNDSKKGLRISKHIFSMLSFFVSLGEKVIGTITGNSIEKVGAHVAKEKIDQAVFTPVQKVIDDNLKEKDKGGIK